MNDDLQIYFVWLAARGMPEEQVRAILREDARERGITRRQVPPVRIPSRLARRLGAALPPTVCER